MAYLLITMLLLIPSFLRWVTKDLYENKEIGCTLIFSDIALNLTKVRVYYDGKTGHCHVEGIFPKFIVTL